MISAHSSIRIPPGSSVGHRGLDETNLADAAITTTFCCLPRELDRTDGRPFGECQRPPRGTRWLTSQPDSFGRDTKFYHPIPRLPCEYELTLFASFFSHRRSAFRVSRRCGDGLSDDHGRKAAKIVHHAATASLSMGEDIIRFLSPSIIIQRT